MYEQITRYKRKYGKNGSRHDEMCQILIEYPNTPVQEIEDVKFFSVVAENETNLSTIIAVEY